MHRVSNSNNSMQFCTQIVCFIYAVGTFHFSGRTFALHFGCSTTYVFIYNSTFYCMQNFQFSSYSFTSNTFGSTCLFICIICNRARSFKLFQFNPFYIALQCCPLFNDTEILILKLLSCSMAYACLDLKLSLNSEFCFDSINLI